MLSKSELQKMATANDIQISAFTITIYKSGRFIIHLDADNHRGSYLYMKVKFERNIIMEYLLKEITLRADNSQTGMAKIDELWRDVVSGKIPLMYDSAGNFQQGLSPISKYSNYESDETGAYDLSIFTATAEFFTQMAQKVEIGEYVAYDFDGADIKEAANKAWSCVWADKESKKIRRAFTHDYESTVPGEYTKDGRAHCYLYIAVKTER